MKKPKRQHWVPCFYLSYFATPETREDDEPKSWILSKHEGDPMLVRIKNVANQRYLYSPNTESSGRSWEMEEKLADYEQLMGQIWPLLATDFVDLYDQSIRKGLALFVALLYLRHPQRLAEIDSIHSQFVEMFQTFPKDQNGVPLVDSWEHNGVIRPFDNSGWHQYELAGPEEKKEMFVKGIRQNATHVARLLMEKRWSIIFSEKPRFITTDAPVVMVHQTRTKFGFRTPGTLVSFPLSPTRVLVMDDRHDQPKGQYYPLAKGDSGPTNLTAWRNCERFMITPRHPHEICGEILAWGENEA